MPDQASQERARRELGSSHSARPRGSLSFLPGRHFLGIRNGPNYIASRLVLSNAVKDYMAKEVVVRPGQVGDLDNHLRPDPMHARQNERRAEPSALGRAHLERHLSGGEGFK
jgi:hypothetical protein